MNDEEEYSFKLRLVFWLLYETDTFFKKEKVREIIAKNGYKIKDGYPYWDYKGNSYPLKWLARESEKLMPVCFHIEKKKFECEGKSYIKGEVSINGHVHFGGALIFHNVVDFDDYYKIEDFICVSQPANIILFPERVSLKDRLDELADVISEMLQKELKKPVELQATIKTSPWHHTWIVWDAKPDFSTKDYTMSGKNFAYVLGLALRTDKWSELDTKAVSEHLELKDLSPYRDDCVYLTNAGNVVVPGEALTDPASMKNTLIDVLFASEIGNVQRFLTLTHLQNIMELSFEFENVLQLMREEDTRISEAIIQLQSLENKLNRKILEISQELIIQRVPRVMFTSLFKTGLLKEQIRVLNGFEYFDRMEGIIAKVRETLSREREMLEIIVSDEENFFLRNLQILFIVTLLIDISGLYFLEIQAVDLAAGTLLLSLSVIMGWFLFILLRRYKR